METKLKSIADFLQQRREDEWKIVKTYIRECGGDGLVCPGECGCGIDDLVPCGESLEDLEDCYPAKGKPGEWEGIECTVYHLVEEVGNGKES